MSRRTPSGSSPAAEPTDPARLLRQRVRMRQQARASSVNQPAAVAPDSDASTPSEGSPPPPASDEPVGADGRPNSPSATTSRRRARTPDMDLEEVGAAYKRQKKLSAESEGDLLSFSKVRRVVLLIVVCAYSGYRRAAQEQMDGDRS
jgi:hypothetical protein